MGSIQQPQSDDALQSDMKKKKVLLDSGDNVEKTREDHASLPNSATVSGAPLLANPPPEVVAFTDPKVHLKLL